MFRLAHLSDPHIGVIPKMRLRQLLNKRLTGYVNFQRNRKRSHDMTLLGSLVSHLKAQNPDHIACTGDIAHIGLPSEWPAAKVFLEELGTSDKVSFVPGNHDAYIKGSLEGLMLECEAWMQGDDAPKAAFPYLRQRGFIALIGLSSATPTAPFVASGRLGKDQLAQAEKLLFETKDQGLCRVVLIHHPPYIGGAGSGRNLTDARAFEEMISRTGAELVLHGHNHKTSLRFIEGPDKLVPILGAPSASAKGGALTDRAAYHLINISQSSDRFALEGATYDVIEKRQTLLSL